MDVTILLACASVPFAALVAYSIYVLADAVAYRLMRKR